MAACAMCGGSIMWARTEDGKSMPLDLPPNPNGSIWLAPDPQRPGKQVALVASKDRPKPDGTRSFTAHFVRCPPYKAKKDLERRLKT